MRLSRRLFAAIQRAPGDYIYIGVTRFVRRDVFMQYLTYQITREQVIFNPLPRAVLKSLYVNSSSPTERRVTNKWSGVYNIAAQLKIVNKSKSMLFFLSRFLYRRHYGIVPPAKYYALMKNIGAFVYIQTSRGICSLSLTKQSKWRGNVCHVWNCVQLSKRIVCVEHVTFSHSVAAIV